MTHRPTARELLDGPRGRRLCFEVAAALLPPGLDIVANRVTHLGEPVENVHRLLREVDPGPVRTLEHPLSLVWPVADSIEFAKYWQPPDETDTLLATHPGLVEALVPVAEAVVDAPATAWWSSGVDLTSLQDIEFRAEHGTRHHALTGVPERLVEWQAEERTMAARAAQERHDDPLESLAVGWWSVPVGAGLPVTTRGLPGLGAVGLMWAEDGDSDYEEADLRRLVAASDARVYEVGSPAAWTALVERFPLDVTAARRPEWLQVTGRDPAWFLPDWIAVAEAYDAVHLTVAGYLTTATRAWDVVVPGTDDAATLLGGWNPDETLWLTDVLEVAGEVERWQDVDDRPEPDPLGPETGWRRV